MTTCSEFFGRLVASRAPAPAPLKKGAGEKDGAKKRLSPTAMNIVILVTFIIGFALMIMPHEVIAQSLNIDLGGAKGAAGAATANGGLSSRVIQLIGLMTVLSLAPSIVIMTTSFVRIVVVLSLLRTALGLQQSPPNAVLISLALFLSAIVMAPTWEQSYQNGIKPFMDNQMEMPEAFDATTTPLKAFMLAQVDQKDLALFVKLSKIDPPEDKMDLPVRVVTPAFMISELKKAFEIGFMLFVPFLVIDLVVASVLMSMGMMMLPPVVVSLPFKLIFFVLVDGWHLVAGSLVQSFHPALNSG